MYINNDSDLIVHDILLRSVNHANDTKLDGNYSSAQAVNGVRSCLHERIVNYFCLIASFHQHNFQDIIRSILRTCVH